MKRRAILPAVQDFCPDGAVHRCIHSRWRMSLRIMRATSALRARFCATKLIEGRREPWPNRLELDQNELELIEHSVLEMEHETGFERNEALADMRYTFIENVVAESVVKCRESKRAPPKRCNIDKVLTGKHTALPVFFGVMFLVFWLTFNVIGSSLSDLLIAGIDALTSLVDARTEPSYGINPVVQSLDHRRRIRGRWQRAEFSAHRGDAVLLSFDIWRTRGIWRASHS